MNRYARSIAILICATFVFPSFAHADNHNRPGLCTDNEIAVALQEGETNSRLRYYKIQNRAMLEEAIADLPVRVESIDIGDVYESGYSSVVAGLFQTYPGSLGAVRVYTRHAESETWVEDVLGSDILNNVETVEIGDANNDGKNDIVIGTEYNRDTTSSRIKIFSHTGSGWVTEDVSPASWQRHVQHVEVKDIDADGENEIIALTSNSYFALQFPMVQIVIFKKIDDVWTMNQIYEAGVLNEEGFLTEFVLSERLAVTNLDSDPDLEIIFGVVRGQTGSPGFLYRLDRVTNYWLPTVITNVSGLVDGLDVGDITGDGEADILFSTGMNLRILERADSGWVENSSEIGNPYAFIYDAAVGDQNNDDENDGVFAAGSNLYQIFRTDEGIFETSSLVNTGVMIDSAQIGDVDNIVYDSSPEIFEFLSAWFAGDESADFNGDGVLTVPDIFAFLSDWYARC